MNYNLVWPVGTDFSRTLAYTDSTGTAINLSGFSAHMEVRPSYESAFKILDLTPTINETLGKITVVIPHTTVPDLSQVDTVKTLSENGVTATGKVGVYDLLLTSPSGVVSKFLQGQFLFEPVVTR